MPGHQVRRRRAGRPQADADLAGRARVAVRGVRRALLVTDQHVTQGRMVAEHVVEREDHPARVAEQDVHALPEDRLADDVGPDPRATLAALDGILVPAVAFVEHLAARPLHRVGAGRASGRDMASPGRRPRGFGGSGGYRQLRRLHGSGSRGPVRRAAAGRRPGGAVALRHCHGPRVLRGSRPPVRVPPVDNEKPPPVSRRGSCWFVGVAPQRSVFRPPGSRREPLIRPRRPRRERRRDRSDTRPEAASSSSSGTVTRRPSRVTRTATGRRSCRSRKPMWRLRLCPPRLRRFAKDSRVRTDVNGSDRGAGRRPYRLVRGARQGDHLRGAAVLDGVSAAPAVAFIAFVAQHPDCCKVGGHSGLTAVRRLLARRSSAVHREGPVRDALQGA